MGNVSLIDGHIDDDAPGMTPMEAWHIISANLCDLYKKRRDENFKGYVEADIQAEVICFQALKEMEERQK